MKNDGQKQTKATKAPVNKEAFKMLAMEIGLNEACRKLGVPIPTGKSWARREGWKLPRRKGGRPQCSLPASVSSSLHPIADALDATREELENVTKTGLMQTLAKAVQALAQKDALSVENITQFKDACLAAAKLFGWDGKPAPSVTVNSDKTVVVCPEEQRQAMIAARAKFLEDRPKSPPLPDQPKLQPGHIGATRVSGDEEQSDTEQTIVQPGQAFAPYFEPHGVDVAASEAEGYGWIVKK